MSTNIGTLTIEMAANVARLQQDMDQAKRVVNDSMQSITQAVDMAKKAMIAFAGIATVDAFAGMIRGSIESAARLYDLAAQTGATVEALSALNSVGKTSGTGLDQISSAMNRLAKNMSGASEESLGASRALQAIGIRFDEFKSLAPEDQMQAVAKAMDNFQDGAGKSAVAMALYGKEGAKMLPFMKDLALVGELHAKVTAEQAAQADNFSDNLVKLKGSSESWKKELAMGMLPALNETAQAYLDVMNGSGGLRDEIRKLSKDGSVTEWTRNAVTALTYLLDATIYVKRGFEVMGEYIGASMAASSVLVTGVIDALGKVKSGDFSGAFDALKGSVSTAGSIVSDFGTRVKDIFSEQTLGDRLRDRIEQIQAMGNAADAAKPKIDGQFNAAGEGADKQTKAYADLVASIREKIKAQGLEQESGAQLTESQKVQLKVDELLEKGVISKADANGREIISLIELLTLMDQQKLAESEHLKRLEELAKANQKDLQDAMGHTQALQQQLTAQLQSNEAVGLSAKGLADLEAARLREKAAVQDQLADYELLEKGNVTLSDQYRQQASLLRGLASARQTGALLKEQMDFWNSIESTAKSVWTDVASGGQNAFQKIGQTLKAAVLDLLWQITAKQWLIQLGVSMGVPGASLAQGATSGIGSSLLGNLGSSVLGAGGVGSTLASVGTGFSAAAGGADLTAAIAAYTEAGMGGTAAGLGAGAALGAIPGWGWAALAGAALLSGMDHSGTYHSGGIAQYSAASGLQTSTTHGAFGAGFGGVDFNKSGMDMASGLAKGVTSVLDSAAAAFGKKAGYEVVAAFADDSSTDGAWGALKISLGGNSVLNWNDTRTSKWAPKTFSDGAAGAAEYANAVAADVTRIIKGMGLPEWAQRFADALPDTASLDDLGKLIQQISDYPAQLLQKFGTSRDALVQQWVQGVNSSDAYAAGAAVANTLVNSIQQSILTTGAGQVFDIINQGIVVPMLDAIVHGEVVSQAVSDAAIQATIAKANQAAAALGALLGDPAFQAALAKLRTTLSDALGSAGSVLQGGQSSAQTVATLTAQINAAMTASAAQSSAAAQSIKDAQAQALSALGASIDKQKAMYQAQADAAQSLATNLRDLFATLKQSVADLRSQALGPAQGAASGSAFISNALAVARATGALPDKDALQQAIQAATAGLSSAQYGSDADRKFQTLKLAGELEALQGITGDQLSEAQYQISLAEDQLKVLQDTLDFYQQASAGSVNATLSVRDAVVAMQAALDTTLTNGFSASGASQATLLDQLTKVARQYSSGTSSAAVSQLAASVSAGTIGIGDAVNLMAGTPAVSALFNSQVNTYKNFDAAGYYGEIRKNVDSLINSGVSGDQLSQTLISYGVSLTDLSHAYNVTAAEIAANLLRAGATHLPQLAVGTNYVPKDMVAMIHEGEAVVPKQFNPWAGGGGGNGNSQSLEKWLAGLDRRFASIEGRLIGIESNTGDAADKLRRASAGAAFRQVAA